MVQARLDRHAQPGFGKCAMQPIGPSRRAIPKLVAKEFSREYPFGWLGILADVPPCDHELIYANHERGFALASQRSEHRSRYYIDVPLTERIEDWLDERIWDELAIRIGPQAAAHITRGPSIEKSIAPLRSYVFAPMRHGSLLLRGDAADIVPPTGAKGLNLAASDVHYAAQAMTAFFQRGDADAIAAYSGKALARVWKAERFSWSLTRLMHCFPEDGPFERAMQVAELEYITSSRAAQTSIAENYKTAWRKLRPAGGYDSRAARASVARPVVTATSSPGSSGRMSPRQATWPSGRQRQSRWR